MPLCPFVLSRRPETSDALRHLVGNMLDKNPQSRITLPSIKVSRRRAKDALRRATYFLACSFARRQLHPWVTECGACPLPLEEDHCTALEVSAEEVENSVTLISSLSTVVSHSRAISRVGRRASSSPLGPFPRGGFFRFLLKAGHPVGVPPERVSNGSSFILVGFSRVFPKSFGALLHRSW